MKRRRKRIRLYWRLCEYIKGLEDYIKKRLKRLITAASYSSDNIRTNGTKTREQKWQEKQPCEYFKRYTGEISHALLIAAQNNPITTNYIKAKIDYTQQKSKCWLCSDRDETINRMIGEYVFIFWVILYIYIYIYIFTNLISTNIHGYQKKRKKTRQEQEIKISRITAQEKKKKYYRTKRKKRPTPSHHLKKNQEICIQLVKRKLKPSVNTAMLQLQRCSTRVEPIIKLT